MPLGPGAHPRQALEELVAAQHVAQQAKVSATYQGRLAVFFEQAGGHGVLGGPKS